MTQQTPLTPEQRQYYLAHKGVRCPFCQSEFISGDRIVSSGDPTVAHANVDCNDCGRQWIDEWRLTDVEEPEEEDEDVDFPWCDACKSYHHPENPSCKKPQRRGDHGPADTE